MLYRITKIVLITIIALCRTLAKAKSPIIDGTLIGKIDAFVNQYQNEIDVPCLGKMMHKKWLNVVGKLTVEITASRFGQIAVFPHR